MYQRGERLFENGVYRCTEADPEAGSCIYEVHGNYGDYTSTVRSANGGLQTSCDCPYPGVGCKHTVAVLLDILDKMRLLKSENRQTIATDSYHSGSCLTADEFRKQAIEDRRMRARTEGFTAVLGDLYKGEHLIETDRGRQYLVTLHDRASGRGHCTCPDFLTNRLGTCKHLIHVQEQIKKKKDL